MKTTLNKIQRQGLLSHRDTTRIFSSIGKTDLDEPISILTILDAIGLGATLSCLDVVEGHEREKRLLAVAFARRVQHLMEPCSVAALNTAERYARGEATKEEMMAAKSAAHFVAWNAGADGAARAAAVAVDADASWAARHACYASSDRKAEKIEQEKILREMLSAIPA